MDECFSWTLVLCFLAITGSVPATATEFNCYQCTYTKNGGTVTDKACDDPFKSGVYRFFVAAKCTTSCYKMVSKTRTGDERVERGCFIPSDATPTCTDSNYHDGFNSGSMSCCKGEGCNGVESRGNQLPSGSSSTTTLGSTTVPATKFNCFKCRYTKIGSTVLNKGCNDPLITKPYRFFVAPNCRTSCYKLVTKTADGNEKVERDCFIPSATTPTCSDSKYDDGLNSGSMSCCKGEGCNAA